MAPQSNHSKLDCHHNSPLIELVDDLEVAVVRADHVLVHEVEGGVGDELVQVTVVILK